MPTSLADKFVSINAWSALINIVLAFALSLIVLFVYKKSHQGLSYSRSLVFSITILSVLSTVVMMVIGSNLARAFTLFGAFTLIRFRTAVKDTRDTTFLFWSIVNGLAVGTGSYGLAVMSTVVLSLIIFFVDKTNITSIRNYDYILNFMLPATKYATPPYQALFDRYLKNSYLLNIATRSGGEKMEYAFDVKFLDSKEISNFLAEVRGIAQIEQVNLVSAKDDIEY